MFNFYKEMGFEFFKLDFLYAVAVVPQNGKSRAKIMYDAMNFIREELKDKTIVCCDNAESKQGQFYFWNVDIPVTSLKEAAENYKKAPKPAGICRIGRITNNLKPQKKVPNKPLLQVSQSEGEKRCLN